MGRIYHEGMAHCVILYIGALYTMATSAGALCSMPAIDILRVTTGLRDTDLAD